MLGRGGFYFRDCFSTYTLSGNGEEKYVPDFFIKDFDILRFKLMNLKISIFLNLWVDDQNRLCFIITGMEAYLIHP